MKQQNSYAQQRGFTIIELVVTFAIMTVVLGLTLLGGRDAEQPLKVLNNAYDVALFVREAQVKGTAITGSGGTGFEGVGVYFVAGSNTLIMFRDNNDSDTRDGLDTDLDTIVLERGVTISALSTGSPLSITFRRPFLNARISSGATTATITVSAGGFSEEVVVTDVGRISVE